MTSKFVPVGDRVVLKKLSHQKKTTASGIFIPDSSKEEYYFGEVVAVGSGKCFVSGKDVPMEVVIGDKVMFSKFAGTNLPEDEFGPDLCVVRMSDIVGKSCNKSSK